MIPTIVINSVFYINIISYYISVMYHLNSFHYVVVNNFFLLLWLFW